VPAPSEGFVTNLSLMVGQLLAENEPAVMYVDPREIWIDAAFRNISLEHIAVGGPVDIVLGILPGRVLAGHVSSFGYGVANLSVESRSDLPSRVSRAAGSARHNRFRYVSNLIRKCGLCAKVCR
jgi:multidrug resistance efflux pump